ncbi:MAG: hypothetical protein U9R10_02385 [Euryarchaeota archaeon]|nr:hypothetical protein [Euryarchaeota archaeon]
MNIDEVTADFKNCICNLGHNLIAKEAGLRAPDIDPSGLITGLPQRNIEELDVDGKLPDIRVKVNLALVPDGQGDTKSFISIKAQSHDNNSVFLSFPSFAIKGSRNKITVLEMFLKEA